MKAMDNTESLRSDFVESRPRAGDKIHYCGKEAGVCVRVEGNLCWTQYHDSENGINPFIWRFKDGLNTMHDWPNKHKAALLPSLMREPNLEDAMAKERQV
jgi:hypothetical protein